MVNRCIRSDYNLISTGGNVNRELIGQGLRYALEANGYDVRPAGSHARNRILLVSTLDATPIFSLRISMTLQTALNNIIFRPRL